VLAEYSRTHGVFGGVSLSGTSLGPDSGANEKVYGKKISGQQILQGAFKRPHKPQKCFRHSGKNRHQTLLVESPNWRPERVKKYTAYELYRR
jgi:lipid-binding SYLF domain-containing protein